MTIESLTHDTRQSFRGLLRTPAFTVAALITLALGVAATTVIFSVVNALLLTPPPYPQPERLFVLAYDEGSYNQSGEMFHFARDRVRAFENVAADGGPTGWNLLFGTHAEHVSGTRISRGYFDVLGVRPLIGRGFNTIEDEPKGPRAVILSHALWRKLFGASNDAIGQAVQLGGIPHTVVGVMPADFRPTAATDLWTPLQVSRQNNSWSYLIMGRLRAGNTRAQTEAELDTLRTAMQRDVRNVSDARAQSTRWTPYQEWSGRNNRDELALLFGAVLFLLVIACANVASLQLVRTAGRRREMATRVALGSGRGRLAQQVLCESFLLSLGGAALGLLSAHWGLPALLSFVPDGMLGNTPVPIDWRVLGFALVSSVVSGVLFALAPAFGAVRLNVRDAMSETGRHSAGRRSMALRRVFTVVEVGLAVVLLAGAGLLIRSFVNLRSVELGFDPTNIIVGKMSLQGASKQVHGGVGPLFERTLAQLHSIPGVTAAAVGNNIPVERGLNLTLRPPAGGVVKTPRPVDWRYVTNGYFSVFGIPLRDGRAFDARDNAQGAPVAIVNEAFGRTFFGRPQVVGEFVQLMGSDPPRQIIGVVADVKGRSGAGWTKGINALGAPAPPVLYVSAAQLQDDSFSGSAFPISWAVRTAGTPPPTIAQMIQETVQAAAPQLPFQRFQTMEQVVANDLEMQRFLMTLLAVFAGAAMALAAVGIYGLTSYMVAQRTQEVGIRMALGETNVGVLRRFLLEGLSLGALGLAVGAAAALVLTRALSSMVFGVTPYDPMTFVSVGVVLLIVSALATLLPSVKASRIDPVRVMRAE